jgi:hypothetical protein
VDAAGPAEATRAGIAFLGGGDLVRRNAIEDRMMNDVGIAREELHTGDESVVAQAWVHQEAAVVVVGSVARLRRVRPVGDTDGEELLVRPQGLPWDWVLGRGSGRRVGVVGVDAAVAAAISDPLRPARRSSAADDPHAASRTSAASTTTTRDSRTTPSR